MEVPEEESGAAFRDMRGFADAVGDPRIADRLERALEGTQSYRRFRAAVSKAGDATNPAWVRFLTARREARAIEWLIDYEICDEAEATPCPAITA